MFELVSDYQPAGDHAIAKLTEGVLSGAKHQVLLGVTARAYFLHHPGGWDSFRAS